MIKRCIMNMRVGKNKLIRLSEALTHMRCFSKYISPPPKKKKEEEEEVLSCVVFPYGIKQGTRTRKYRLWVTKNDRLFLVLHFVYTENLRDEYCSRLQLSGPQNPRSLMAYSPGQTMTSRSQDSPLFIFLRAPTLRTMSDSPHSVSLAGAPALVHHVDVEERRRVRILLAYFFGSSYFRSCLKTQSYCTATKTTKFTFSIVISLGAHTCVHVQKRGGHITIYQNKKYVL